MVLLALHLVLGTALIGWGRRLGRAAAWWALAAPLATVAWVVAHWSAVTGPDGWVEHVSWLPRLGVGFDLRVDGFAALLVVLVSGVGLAVFAYAARYLPAEGPRVGRLVGLLVVFGGAMLGLVTADNLLVLYGFWELTSVASFLLIGNDPARPEARAAALQAFLVTGAGALTMLGGFLLLGAAAGTYRLSEIVAAPPTGGTVGVALALILVGAFTKSAQYPFHSWLPGAMVAPTPVSAYLHSATMVKAGVYLIARLSPAFAGDIGWWQPVVVTVGLTTMVAGGLRALRQTDLKLLLAHGTVSQLGFLVAVFGIGTPLAMAAGAALLVAHAVFKAANFLAVGIVDHQFGTRDLRRLPRLDFSWTPTVAATVVGAASMAGVPLAFGFVAKELDLEVFLAGRGGAWPLAQVAVVTGAALTAAYSVRFLAGLTGRSATDPVAVIPADVRPPSMLVAPLLALASVTVLFGVAPGLLDHLVGAAERSLHEVAIPVHLALWHGWNAPLAASAIALTAGGLLHLARDRVRRVLAVGHRVPDANAGYRGILRGLNGLADRVTGVSQPGSLPIYAGVILLTAAALPVWGLTRGGAWPGWPDLVETPAHLPVVAVLLGAALAASVVRRRFSAAVFLGVAGYAMAALFVVQGAPDLALTQVAMETLSTVLFVLVLRRLPDRFGWADDGTPTAGRTAAGPSDSVMRGRTRLVRVLVAVAVGAAVFVLAIVMAGPNPSTPTSTEMIERAQPEAHGRNVVNVILVDFRGFDTLGEITVLAAAAIGTVALARAGRRPGQPPTARAASAGGTAGERRAPAIGLGRLVVLDVAVRVVFAAVIVGSLYLLFAGHNQPGGGFVGGILAGAAVSLRYVAGGIGDVRALSRARPWTVLGTGLVLSIGTAIAPLLAGRPVLTSGYHSFDLPVIGPVGVGSVLIFDVGVYLAVLALALMMFESFGDDPVAETAEASVVVATPVEGASR